jgi:hypothetical protein
VVKAAGSSNRAVPVWTVPVQETALVWDPPPVLQPNPIGRTRTRTKVRRREKKLLVFMAVAPPSVKRFEAS